jgi:antitoxin HicB
MAVKSRTPQGARPKTYPPHPESPKQSSGADRVNVPYPVTLVRDDVDGVEWIATIDALPECSARGATPDEALGRVSGEVTAWVEAAEREGKDVPEPKSLQSHSGRLLLRMPQTLHADLARAADRERVSLNQFITAALSGALGWRAPARKTPPRTRAVPTEGFDAIDGETGAEPATVRGESQRRPGLATVVFVANGIIVALAAVVAIVVLIAALR